MYFPKQGDDFGVELELYKIGGVATEFILDAIEISRLLYFLDYVSIPFQIVFSRFYHLALAVAEELDILV